MCDECSVEGDDKYLGICRRCDMYEILYDGDICKYCEKEGIRCFKCNVWDKAHVKFRGGEYKRQNPHVECKKCKNSFCDDCEPKHMSRSCWSCAKVECPDLMKKCKICKKNLCSECSPLNYCNLCFIRLSVNRHRLQIPKDILTVLRTLIQDLKPNTFLKDKCEHKVEWWNMSKCSDCRIKMCCGCADKHWGLVCSKCGTYFCGNKYWRTCNMCSRTICNRCPNIITESKCPCKDVYGEQMDELRVGIEQIGSAPPGWASDDVLLSLP